ncbi:MAG: hypothetical protein HW406_19 [Candidatus Brocadiaceae bacterium]|nr:hypothetical protein [Candidatus Brocadiaceae bacterium]
MKKQAFVTERTTRRMIKKRKGKPVMNSPLITDHRKEKLPARATKKDIQDMTEDDIRALAHELQVHQLELEMQGEELRRTREKADDGWAWYKQLYDFAPVGYFDIDKLGTIKAVNLSGAGLLGLERNYLIGKRFQQFIKPDSIPGFNTFCHESLENKKKQTCEVELIKHDASSCYVQLESSEVSDLKTKQCRVTATDITAYKQAEQKIHLLQTLSLAISTDESLHSVLKIILRRVCELSGWIYGEIWIPSHDGKHLVYGQAWHGNLGYLKEFIEQRKEFTFLPGIGLPGRAWITRQPAWINNVTLDPHYMSKTIAKAIGLKAAVDTGLKAAVAFPIMAGEEVVAVIVSYLFKQIEKDEHLVNLMSSMSTHLGWVIKRKQMCERLQHMAYHDTLTSLPNRLQFKDRLTLELYHARRNKEKLAVMFVDLDQFKKINDTLGHGVGDQLLQCIATRLKSCTREVDTVSRFGGDEFTVILPKIGKPGDAEKIARKIIEVVRRPVTIGTREIIITTSIGIAVYPDNGEDVETLIYQADAAMYLAKEAGKNNYQFSGNIKLGNKSKKNA